MILLERLFALGQERCNVMILRDRVMQSRGLAPYYDYMPHFLNDCFVGAFSRYFRGNDDLRRWIDEQRLKMFFGGEVARENILDLSGQRRHKERRAGRPRFHAEKLHLHTRRAKEIAVKNRRATPTRRWLFLTELFPFVFFPIQDVSLYRRRTRRGRSRASSRR